jgi:hypothetical protein
MKKPKRLILSIVLVGFVSTGCQTFTLTEDEFEQQQHGEPADPEAGAAVAFVATAACMGAGIGAAVAGVK